MEGSGGRLPTGTVTFLFSDIEGSTRLAHELDPPTYRELLEQHHRLLRAAFAAHGGAERGTQGDAFLVIFRDAPSAVAAAVDAQRSLAAAAWPSGADVRVRMGLHSGEGIAGGDDYVGLDINRAARIAGAAHGGQVLLSDSTRALSDRALPSGVTLHDAGEHRLKSLDLPERVYELRIEGLRTDFPPLRALGVGAAHLPARMTSFVGRRSDLDELRRLLRERRLITLVGPGGTGKTSLAVELARRIAADLADGSWFVDLAPLTDAALVGPTVARRLGLKEQPDRPIVDLLTAHLESRELLLVLDNFEQVLAAREVVERILEAAPRIRVLVTSRRLLGLYGEQEFPVPPLELPDPRAAADPARLSRVEAVALFVERARAAKPDFSLTKETAPAVAAICVRLDGLPLAIELAASRVRLLEPAEILARLERRLSLLTSGATNVPARQRTLRGAIEWSHELLGPAERRLFARLAIFAGGCTLEAAEAVCDPGGELGIDAFEGVAALVEQSLVQRRGDAGESRFWMLETIREYGRERLSAAGELADIGRRHLAHYRALAESAEPHLMGPDQPAWLDRFEREHDNVRAALGHALESGDEESGLRLASAVWRFWLLRGHLREGRSWLEALLARASGVAPAVLAKSYGAFGGLLYWLADADATERAYEAALRLARLAGDRVAEARAAYDLAFVPVMRGDFAATMRAFEESLGLAQEIGHADLVALNKISLGNTVIAQKDARAALPYFEEALVHFQPTGDRVHTGWAVAGIAHAHQLLGRYEEGRAGYRQALRIFGEARDLPMIATSLEELAALESSAGRHANAMRLTGAAAALNESTGASAPIMRLWSGQVEAAARAALGDAAADEALAAGRRMGLDEAIEYAAGLTD